MIGGVTPWPKTGAMLSDQIEENYINLNIQLFIHTIQRLAISCNNCIPKVHKLKKDNE